MSLRRFQELYRLIGRNQRRGVLRTRGGFTAREGSRIKTFHPKAQDHMNPVDIRGAERVPNIPKKVWARTGVICCRGTSPKCVRTWRNAYS
jgi:hypothetical protein